MRHTFQTNKTGRRDRGSRTTHKLLSTVTAIFLCFGQTTSVLAQTAFEGNLNTISISDAAGANSPPAAKFTYTKEGDSFSFDASGSSDSDGNIATYKWLFGDGTVLNGQTVTYVPTESSAFLVTLTVFDDNNAMTLNQQKIILTQPFSAAFNFQPAAAAVPDNFIADSGGAYDLAKGYGWQGIAPGKTRERTSDMSEDLKNRTLIHVAKSNGPWELDVANGIYTVSINCGDLDYTSVCKFAVEGRTLLDSVTGIGIFANASQEINVTDGKITLSVLSDGESKLNWLTVQ